MGDVIREGYSGSGPGAITPDGCAVDLYARLTAGAEPDIIAAAIPAGSSLLELGCGAGRVTRPLAERGFAVTAVDESADMLAHVAGIAGVRTVRSPIETLELDESFDAVTLASFLVHNAERGVADGMLRACRRHVRDGGHVLVQREAADLYSNVPRERVDPSGYTMRVASVTPVGDGVNAVHVEYIWPDATWTQTFRSRQLSTEEFEALLTRAGLVVDRYLTEDEVWLLARPSSG